MRTENQSTELPTIHEPAHTSTPSLLSKLRSHKVGNVVFWIGAILIWPISLSIYLYKKSKAISHKGIRIAAFTCIAVFAVFSSSVWAAALFSSNTTNRPNQIHQSSQAPKTSDTDNDTNTELTSTASTQSAPQLQNVPAPPAIGSRTKTSGCIVSGALEDKACSPGAVFANVTKTQVCQSGYASSVRNVSESTKNTVYAEYGIATHTTGQYEVDHLVSLELGGSNDIANLWPEAAAPTPGFHQKDVIENELHAEVCNGTISITQAQDEIASNWLALYQGTTPSITNTPQTTTTTTIPPAQQTSPSSTIVKLSTTGICHAPGDAYYDRTTNYSPYASMQACIDAGGRPSLR